MLVKQHGFINLGLGAEGTMTKNIIFSVSQKLGVHPENLINRCTVYRPAPCQSEIEILP